MHIIARTGRNGAQVLIAVEAATDSVSDEVLTTRIEIMARKDPDNQYFILRPVLVARQVSNPVEVVKL